MTIRSLLTHAGLLAVMLIVAWTVHFADDEAPKDDEGTVYLAAGPGETEAVILVEDKRTRRIESRRDDRGRWFYGVETTQPGYGGEKAGKSPHGAGVPGHDHGASKPKPTPPATPAPVAPAADASTGATDAAPTATGDAAAAPAADATAPTATDAGPTASTDAAPSGDAAAAAPAPEVPVAPTLAVPPPPTLAVPPKPQKPDDPAPVAAPGVAPAPPAASAAPAVVAAPAEPEGPKTVNFQAGPVAESLWELLEPVKVLRIVDEVSEEKLEEFGLNEPGGTLTIVVRGTEHVFELGGKTFGGANTYARTADGKIVVFASRFMRDLKADVRRMRDGRLLESGRTELRKLVMSVGAKSLELSQDNASEPHRAAWRRTGDDAANEQYKAVMNRVFALQATDHTDEEPNETWQERMRIQVIDGSGAPEAVVLYQVLQADGTTGWRARSNHLRVTAKIQANAADTLVSDIEALVK